MIFHSTQQTVSWFIDRYRDGSLTLRPPYQRKPVWTAKQRCSLVESVLLGLPIPEVFVQQTTTAEGVTTWAVVDGQQRIRTLIEFVGVSSGTDGPEKPGFVLDRVSPQSAWRNESFATLTEESKRSFFQYVMAVPLLNGIVW